MADVPVWVLVVQTLAAGGFGLAGSFIVPAAQRHARREEANEKGRALMREKAEAIFSELARVRQVNNSAHTSLSMVLQNRAEDPGIYDMTVFRALDTVIGVIATYYPSGLQIIADERAKLRLQTDPINAALGALGAGPLSPDGLQLRAQMTMAVAVSNADIAGRLELFMVDAVRPFHPAAPHAAREP